jgi:hypothetical protein
MNSPPVVIRELNPGLTSVMVDDVVKIVVCSEWLKRCDEAEKNVSLVTDWAPVT